MTREQWLEAHPYLRPLAKVTAQVERALAELAIPDARIPDWEDYRPEFLAGVPLLSSADAAIDLEPGARVAAALVERVAPDLDADPRLIVDFLLGDEAVKPPSSGLLRFLGWTAMARFLRPALKSFDGWRDETRWLRRYCPTCGSLPAMAQLVGKDPGRVRLLSCGCCGTRWRFKRTACPFCETDTQRLTSVNVAGEHGLRIDSCASCSGYLKTYDGEGDEDLFLADWSSLHLDLVASDRGLKKRAASLYEFEPFG